MDGPDGRQAWTARSRASERSSRAYRRACSRRAARAPGVTSSLVRPFAARAASMADTSSTSRPPPPVADAMFAVAAGGAVVPAAAAALPVQTCRSSLRARSAALDRARPRFAASALSRARSCRARSSDAGLAPPADAGGAVEEEDPPPPPFLAGADLDDAALDDAAFDLGLDCLAFEDDADFFRLPPPEADLKEVESTAAFFLGGARAVWDAGGRDGRAVPPEPSLGLGGDMV
mmetsp:Transcript_26558/g.62993  ORF Transcript_26558/g.62993 Transcript_26558/m.62993 type:complete len:233 (-) Transcript_26558:52-750(-)